MKPRERRHTLQSLQPVAQYKLSPVELAQGVFMQIQMPAIRCNTTELRGRVVCTLAPYSGGPVLKPGPLIRLS
jgi:hypothetical protein